MINKKLVLTPKVMPDYSMHPGAAKTKTLIANETG